MAWVDLILDPLGWRTVILTSVLVKLFAGALVVSSKMDAAVSIKAVFSRCGGLAQLNSRLIELVNFWSTTATDMDSTGAHHQVVGCR